MLSQDHLAQLEHPWDVASVTWELQPSSIVIEVGAYKGRWASIMNDLYGCKIFAFEPQPWAYELTRQKLDPFDNARVFNHALGDRCGKFEMGEYETDGCSFLKVGQRGTGMGEMKEIAREFTMLGIERIDVMLINIEGYEYTLIPYMARIGLLEIVDALMVQWHKFAVSEAQHEEVLNAIAQTHNILWHWDALTAWKARQGP